MTVEVTVKFRFNCSLPKELEYLSNDLESLFKVCLYVKGKFVILKLHGVYGLCYCFNPSSLYGYIWRSNFLLVGTRQELRRLSRLNRQFYFDLFTGTHAKLVKKLHTLIHSGVKTSLSVHVLNEI